MFGLPDITIIAVGGVVLVVIAALLYWGRGVVLVVIAALLYWGLTFGGHD